MGGDTIRMEVVHEGDDELAGLRTIQRKPDIGTKAYAFPRTLFRQVCEKPELSKGHQCVYVLWGEHGARPAYVGESDDLKVRFSTHLGDKEKKFWEHTAVYTHPELHKTHAQYIEKWLSFYAAEAGKCVLKNDRNTSQPKPRNIPEKDIADSHLNNARRFFFPLAGCDFFSGKSGHAAPKQKAATVTDARVKTASSMLYLRARGVEAFGYKTEGEFVVCKDAQAVIEETRSMLNPRRGHENLLPLRNKLKKEVLRQSGDLYVFSKDYRFTSPSQAAAMILGHPSNGLALWKNDEGYSLKELQEMPHSGKKPRKVKQKTEKLPLQEGVLYLETSGLTATCRQTADGFIVHAGSQASKRESRVLRPQVAEIRKNLRKQGVLVDAGETYCFAREYSFSKPSAASSVILGYPSNGREVWKNGAGVTLKVLEDKQER